MTSVSSRSASRCLRTTLMARALPFSVRVIDRPSVSTQPSVFSRRIISLTEGAETFMCSARRAWMTGMPSSSSSQMVSRYSSSGGWKPSATAAMVPAGGSIGPVRAVMLEVPQALLDERRAHGLDKSDEMWEGELHMVPPPSFEHQRLGAKLFLALGPLAEVKGLLALYDPTGVFRPGADQDWRVPDQVYARPEVASARGIEGAADLVVEILSPQDETYAKLEWYASVGVGEVLVVDPSTGGVELFANRDGRMGRVEPAVITSLAVHAETVDGKLRLTWDGGTTDI